ncbi:hypothetical protein [Luteitalea sp.]|jgi:hypothetical protein|uniref:hypothetical protein n=1 Tax=Luteitalea sp. TaxID=2004800 RepID=UPI0025BEDD36|nr:hypothetical protein [Luteitalea sp.]
MTSTRLAVIDTGQVNERILNKDEYRADFRKVEGASLKRTTHLSSPHAKRLFARCFYSFQASMYFISELGRVKLDHEVVERIEQNIRESLDSATTEINTAIDQAEALLKHHNIDVLASYDTVPLQVEIGITSSFGRRYFDLMHKLDVVMPMMETLAIEEIINERELETRRSMYKRAVLHISTRARNLWMGVRRRMNERDARLAAEAAKPKPTGQRRTASGEPDGGTVDESGIGTPAVAIASEEASAVHAGSPTVPGELHEPAGQDQEAVRAAA